MTRRSLITSRQVLNFFCYLLVRAIVFYFLPDSILGEIINTLFFLFIFGPFLKPLSLFL